jgi:VanZ family protein
MSDHFPVTRSQPCATWSLRILSLSVAGILFLTLFPFRFAMPSGHTLILIAGMGKTGTSLDIFLNVLLMFPLGFGVAEYLSERGKSQRLILLSSFFAGFLFSYTIETLQIYVPGRDSGWGDVITNTSGSVLGAIAFGAFGDWVLRTAGNIEAALAAFLTPRAAALLFCVYFGIWLPVSFTLQKESRLSNWNANAVLLVNDNPGVHAPGSSAEQVLRLELWNQALPNAAVAALSSGSTASSAPNPITAYDFTSRLPVRDEAGLLPPITGKPASAAPYDSLDTEFAGRPWNGSQVTAGNLAEAIQRTNHFSIFLVYRPERITGPQSRILWIGTAEGPPNLWLRQDGPNLIVSVRNPLSARRAQLAWAIPGVFTRDETRNIVLTYDGASLSFFLNGRRSSRLYRLGPGTALAQLFRWPRAPELEAYSDIYYAVLFFPAGIVMGFALRNLSRGHFASGLILAALFAAPPILLEVCLVGATGRRVEVGRVILSYALLVGGALWINAEGRRRRHGEAKSEAF